MAIVNAVVINAAKFLWGGKVGTADLSDFHEQARAERWVDVPQVMTLVNLSRGTERVFANRRVVKDDAGDPAGWRWTCTSDPNMQVIIYNDLRCNVTPERVTVRSCPIP